MTTNIRKYIDLNIIDEHAYKSFRKGFSLDVGDIPHAELKNFMDMLFDNHEGFKDMVLDKMQEMIDARLPIYECEYKYSAGLKPYIDNNNGEVTWRA